MLKTLEEPPPYVHLLLLVDRLDDLLPTILSRCQRVRFDPPSSDQIAARLTEDGVTAAVAQASARLALGDALLAATLASDPGVALRAAAEHYVRDALAREPAQKPWGALLDAARAAGERAADELREIVAQELTTLPTKEQRRHEREATDRVRRADRRARTHELDLGLRLAGLWLRDVALVADGMSELAYATDRESALAQDARERSGSALRTAVQLVQDTRQRLALNVSEELALEALSFRLRGRLSV
jgi:DNA polymerase-3 subunit delta'